MSSVEGYFHQPYVIDERKRRHFIEEVMPTAAPLATEDDEMVSVTLSGCKIQESPASRHSH